MEEFLGITNIEYEGLLYQIMPENSLEVIKKKQSYAGDIVIPKNIIFNNTEYTVTSIGESFSGCRELTSVSIPTSVVELSNKCFYGCVNLSYVDIQGSVSMIPISAFQYCEKLTKLNLPSSVNSIENSAFMGCSSLTSFNSPSCLTRIGNSAFQDCILLNEVRFSDSLNSVGNSAFNGCVGLSAIQIPNNIVAINDSTFYGCSNLSQITNINQISSIGNSSFENCTSLESMEFDNLQSVFNYAFKNCSALTNIDLGNKLTSLGDYAMANCDKITEMEIPGSVVNLGQNVFSGCTGLRELTFEDSNNPLLLPNGAYDTATGVQKKNVNGKTIQFKIQYYEPLFSDLPIEKLYIGRNLSRDSRYTISGDGGVDYYLITSYDAPFENLSNLKELIIGEKVDILGPEQEYIPEVDLYVTPGSFKSCSSIQSIEVKNPTPPTGAEFTNNVYSNASLIVPKGSENEYEKATGWKNFVNLIIETDSIVLDQQTITINVYDEHQLNATVYPENATDTTIIWTSSDETVVKVSNSGRITGVSAGKATITAACGNVSASCEVEVVIVGPNEIILNKQAIMTTVNSVYQLHATVYPEDVTDKTVIWTSSDESVAKVSDSGYVTGISVGKATITASCGNVSASCDVEVEVENFIKTQPTADNLLVELNTPEEDVKYQWYRLVEGMIYSKEIVPTSSGEYAWTESNGVWTSGNNKEGPQTFSVMTATVRVQLGDTISFDYTVPKGDGRYDGGSQWLEFTINGKTNMQTFGGVNGGAGHYELDINDYIIDRYLNEDSTMTIGFECVRKNTERATVSNIKHTRPTGFYKGMVDKKIIGATAARLDDSLFVEGSVVYCVVTLPNGKTLTSDKVNMYKVYYYVGEELVHTAEVAYGEVIPEYVYEPTVEGDEFLGWIGETYATMPAHDVTYTANIESGIEELTIDNSQLTIYDLTGRKVTDTENLKGGIYIVNGRKVVVE